MPSAHVEPETTTFEAQLDHELDAVERARQRLRLGRNPSAGKDAGAPQAKQAQRRVGARGDTFDRAHADNLLGLAFSGGGIRSATFNLGVIQRLASLRLLHRVDYLSTVSGGGYIGSWLSAWVHRQQADQGVRAGILGVEDRLCADAASQVPEQPTEPRQVRWLREFSNYLTPRVGVFSTDTLTGVATFVRNLLLNQAILVASGASLLVLPWFLAAALPHLSDGWVWAGLWLAVLLLVVGCGVAGYETLRADLGRVAGHASDQADAAARRRYWVLFGCFAAASVIAGVLITYRPALPGWEWILAFGGAYGIGTSVGWWSAAHRYRQQLREVDPRKLRRFLPFWALLAGAALFGMLVCWTWVAQDSAPRLASPLPAVTLGPLAVLGAILLTITVHLGLAGRRLREAGRELWSSHGAHQMRFGVIWLVFSASSLFGPLVLILADNWIAALGGITWVLTTGAGVLAGSGATTGPKGGSKLSELAARIAPYVFVLGVLLIISYGLYRAMWWTWEADAWPEATEAVAPRAVVCEPAPRQPLYEFDLNTDGGLTAGRLYEARHPTYQCLHGYVEQSAVLVEAHWAQLLLIALAMMLAALVLSWRVDVNVFGLHMFYRSRIERCYMGASNLGRRPHPYTGLDPTDAPRLADLVQEPGSNRWPAEPLLGQRPFPIVNTALNLTSARNLAWQERKAASFTFTPMYCGYEIREPDGRLISCFQRSDDYVRKADGWISLGLPITISGAAASPNAGYHTSAATAFLMTVFNVRLGWWMQNPRYRDRWQQPGPRLAMFRLVQELFAMTTDTSNYVYLSDGGHFENLGIYELVRRRCRYIIACDAGCDPSYRFEDLGNAIRKCQIDLGIDIDIDPGGIRPDPRSGRSGMHCAVGRIHYERTDKNARPGYLLYLKSSLTSSEPADILQYAAEHADFPHETTADQWYSESQFESYRKLGSHIVDAVLADAVAESGGSGGVDLEEMFNALSERWYPPSPEGRSSFSRYGEAVETIFERVRHDKNLRFLDRQVYPEWCYLTDAGRPGEIPPTPTMLPKHAWEVRAGFYLCNSMLQIMENVYHDLNLEEEYRHPDNRGWMNLFRHWSWAGMLRVTWAISASMYGARFQRFCRRQLDLPVGEVTCGELVSLADLDDAGLNFLEAEQVRKMVTECFWDRQDSLFVVRLSLQVISPFEWGEPAAFAFPFGFALIDRGETQPLLLYYRVQDHLREIGLGRKGLARLLAEHKVEAVIAPDSKERDLVTGVIPEASYAALQRLWSSVIAARMGRGADAEKRDWLV